MIDSDDGEGEVTGAVLVVPAPLEVRLDPEPVAAPVAVRARINELWQQERQRNPTVFDGTILSVDRVQAGLVTARPCAYRLFIARERDEQIRAAVPVRALAVSGLVLLGHEPDLGILVGRRSPDVTEYPGAWELIPSGGVDAGRAGPDGLIDVVGALLDELEQEAGVLRAAVTRISALGLIHDRAQDGYDICFVLRAPEARPVPMPEYAETAIASAREATELFNAQETVPTSRVILKSAIETRGVY